MTEKTSISMRPVQKIGADWPRAASPTASRSTGVPRRTAAAMPSGTESSTARTSAVTARSMEAGSRSMTRRMAGCWCWSDVPKSPRRSFCTNRQYWTWRGWSSPSARVSASTSSREGLGGSSIITGSPVMWRTTKTSVRTQAATTTV